MKLMRICSRKEACSTCPDHDTYRCSKPKDVGIDTRPSASRWPCSKMYRKKKRVNVLTLCSSNMSQANTFHHVIMYASDTFPKENAHYDSILITRLSILRHFTVHPKHIHCHILNWLKLCFRSTKSWCACPPIDTKSTTFEPLASGERRARDLRIETKSRDC